MSPVLAALRHDWVQALLVVAIIGAAISAWAATSTPGNHCPAGQHIVQVARGPACAGLHWHGTAPGRLRYREG